MRVIVATKNKHKIDEIQAITKEFGMEIISRADAGVPDIEIEEDGETFEENSEKKARGIMELCGDITIADDSGLMVDALDGAPGVYSARFAGEDGNDAKNNEKTAPPSCRHETERQNSSFCIGNHYGLSGRTEDRSKGGM